MRRDCEVCARRQHAVVRPGRRALGLQQDAVPDTNRRAAAAIRHREAAAAKRKERLASRFRILIDELPRAVWTHEVSRTFGTAKAEPERKGVRIEDFDVAVAAHALALDATLMTDNVDRMSRIPGLRIDNWLVRPANPPAPT